MIEKHDIYTRETLARNGARETNCRSLEETRTTGNRSWEKAVADPCRIWRDDDDDEAMAVRYPSPDSRRASAVLQPWLFVCEVHAVV